jgi:hypothetical protein
LLRYQNSKPAVPESSYKQRESRYSNVAKLRESLKTQSSLLYWRRVGMRLIKKAIFRDAHKKETLA